MQASIWPSWCFDRKIQPVSGAWRRSTPCVRWSNPGFALIHSLVTHYASFFVFLDIFSLSHSCLIIWYSDCSQYVKPVLQQKHCTLSCVIQIAFFVKWFQNWANVQKTFPLCESDSLPGQVPGVVPAACEGGSWGNVQKRLLSKLVSGKLLGCPL